MLRPILRPAIRTLRLVIVGAILTVLVAWSCILFASPQHGSAPAISAGVPVSVAGPPGEEPGQWFHVAGRGWTAAEPHGYRIYGDGGDDSFKDWMGGGTPAVRAAGWPCYALWSRVDAVESHRGIAYPTRWQLPAGEILRRGIPTESLPTEWLARLHPRLAANEPTRLPLVPLWPGFLVDTVVFGALALLLAHFARRALRTLRARNPARGFPISP